MNCKPYTYLLHCIPTNQWYYGVRFAKDCHPDEFWIKYFTTSKYVKKLIQEHGLNAFEFEIRRTFNSPKESRNWEHKVLQRMKVLEKPGLWLNRTDNKAILNDKAWFVGLPKERHPSYGSKRTEESKEKNRQAHLGKLIGESNPSKRPEVRLKISMNNPMKSDKMKAIYSDRMMGNQIGIGNQNAKKLKGYKQSKEHIEKRVAARLKSLQQRSGV